MPEWVSTMLRLAVPILLAGGIGALTSALVQPRRLRREIASDAAALESLRGVPRGLIAQDMHDNAIRLAAWRRYPAMHALDWFKVSVLLATLGIQGAITWAYATDPESQSNLLVPESYLGLTLPFFIALTAWTSFNRTWLWRREDRVEMIRRHGVTQDPDLMLFWSHVTLSFSTLIGTGVVFGVACIQWLTVNEALDGPRWVNACVMLLVLLGAPAYVTLVHPHHHRPKSWAERQEQEVRSMVEAERQARLKRERRKEMGLHWWQRLPKDEPPVAKEGATDAVSAEPGQTAIRPDAEETD